MKRSKFSEEQIAYALRQVESGTPPADVCRQVGISEATLYVWKKKLPIWARVRCAGYGSSRTRTIA
jgi:transposase-like protein